MIRLRRILYFFVFFAQVESEYSSREYESLKNFKMHDCVNRLFLFFSCQCLTFKRITRSFFFSFSNFFEPCFLTQRYQSDSISMLDHEKSTTLKEAQKICFTRKTFQYRGKAFFSLSQFIPFQLQEIKMNLYFFSSLKNN